MRNKSTVLGHIAHILIGNAVAIVLVHVGHVQIHSAFRTHQTAFNISLQRQMRTFQEFSLGLFGVACPRLLRLLGDLGKRREMFGRRPLRGNYDYEAWFQTDI